MPKVSIILPIYNVEKYLSKCLESCINQTLQDIEIICVNDGSTDNCLKIINEYAEKDSRIKVINQENQGVSIARNNGINTATGEYILFLDPDDWIISNCCELAYNQAKENNNDFVCFLHYSCTETGEIVSQANFDNFKEIIANKQINPKEEKNDKYIHIGVIWNKLYNREWLDNNNLRFMKIKWEDTPFAIISFVHANSFSFLDKPLYCYRTRNGSLTGQVSLEEAINSRMLPLNYILKNESNINILKAYLRYCCFSLFYWYQVLPKNKEEKLKFRKLMILGLEKAKKYDYRIKFYLLLLKLNIFSLYYLINKVVHISKFFFCLSHS